MRTLRVLPQGAFCSRKPAASSANGSDLQCRPSHDRRFVECGDSGIRLCAELGTQDSALWILARSEEFDRTLGKIATLTGRKTLASNDLCNQRCGERVTLAVKREKVSTLRRC